MIDIRAIRTELGLSQSELGELLGLHQTTISRFESGDMLLDRRTRLALDALLSRSAERVVDDHDPDHDAADTADHSASETGKPDGVSEQQAEAA